MHFHLQIILEHLQYLFQIILDKFYLASHLTIKREGNPITSVSTPLPLAYNRALDEERTAVRWPPRPPCAGLQARRAAQRGWSPARQPPSLTSAASSPAWPRRAPSQTVLGGPSHSPRGQTEAGTSRKPSGKPRLWCAPPARRANLPDGGARL